MDMTTNALTNYTILKRPDYKEITIENVDELFYYVADHMMKQSDMQILKDKKTGMPLIFDFILNDFKHHIWIDLRRRRVDLHVLNQEGKKKRLRMDFNKIKWLDVDEFTYEDYPVIKVDIDTMLAEYSNVVKNKIKPKEPIENFKNAIHDYIVAYRVKNVVTDQYGRSTICFE